MAAAELPAGLSPDDAQQIDRDLAKLTVRLADLKGERGKPLALAREDLLADVEVFCKGVVRALKYETKLAPADVALIRKALARSAERADALAAGKPIWPAREGRLVRGDVSSVDGSVQPFGLVIPAGYDPAKPARLDVVLQGSLRPVGLSNYGS